MSALLDIDLGVDVDIADDAPPSAAPTATDTGFLIQSVAASGSPHGLTTLHSAGEGHAAFPGEMALLAQIDAFFNIGGARLYVSTLSGPATGAAALFTDQMGPGQVVAPELLTAVAQAPLRDWAYATNRIYIASTTDGTAKAALETQSAALINATSGRNALLEADTLLIPGVAGGSAREVNAAICTAALMARSDIATGNPNLAAAGNHTPGSGGQSDYIIGIKAERSKTDQEELATHQVNCWRTVNNRTRRYGNWTLADLTALPHWWDVSGSRTIMAIRAQEAAVAEEMMFGQVDANNIFLDRYEGGLKGVLAALQRLGAIFGTDGAPGYTVDVSAAVNPFSRLAHGKVSATITVKTAPGAAELTITLTRLAIA